MIDPFQFAAAVAAAVAALTGSPEPAPPAPAPPPVVSRYEGSAAPGSGLLDDFPVASGGGLGHDAHDLPNEAYGTGWIVSPYSGRLVCVTGAPCEQDSAFTGPETSSYNWVTGEVN